jgi:xanthosine utilization system XapX-like protein
VKSRLVLSGLPLIVYPFVAFASLMSLAGQKSPSDPLVSTLGAYGFFVGSLSYPLVYGIAAAAAWACVKSEDMAAADKLSRVPKWYLAFLGACVLAMAVSG